MADGGAVRRCVGAGVFVVPWSVVGDRRSAPEDLGRKTEDGRRMTAVGGRRQAVCAEKRCVRLVAGIRGLRPG